MAAFKKWLEKAFVSIVDPDRDGAVQELQAKIQYDVLQQREAFDLSRCVQGLEFSPRHLELAKEGLFQAIVARGWQKGSLSAEDRRTIPWLIQKLELDPGRAAYLNLDFAREAFRNVLIPALHSGVIDQDSEARLTSIAESVGQRLDQFAGNYFRGETLSYLERIFRIAAETSAFTEHDWNFLTGIATKLGIPLDDLLIAVEPLSRMLIERVLLDAKSDNYLSPTEELQIKWLLKTLRPRQDFAKYVWSEVFHLRTLAEIEDGTLPKVMAPPAIELKAGELVHYCCHSEWRIHRELATGTRVESHQGLLVITDNRVIFSSPSKSQSFSHRKVVSHSGGRGYLVAQLPGKPAARIHTTDTTELAYAVFKLAVALHNQTRIARSTTDKPSRHIPRDIRQRVFQQYGGRCVDCGATDYLEYDHIIPVAKGGSNSEANVQLLCRRCNLKKSDKI